MGTRTHQPASAAPAGRLPLVLDALSAALLATLWWRYHAAPDTYALLLFVLLAGLSAWRPLAGFAALLTVWPAADRVVWHADLFLTESDLAALAVLLGAALGALRRPPLRPQRHPMLALGAPAALVLALLGLAFGIGVLRAFDASPPLTAVLPAGYASPWNALRLAKGLVWGLWLARTLQRTLRSEVGSGLDGLLAGFCGGLAVVGIAVLVERLRFTGLLDFAQDYRVTAPFWEMHVGGAALDAFLALSLPFALFAALRLRRPLWLGAVAVLLALAAYAALVSFSRSVYAAVATILLVFLFGGGLRTLSLRRRFVALICLLALGLGLAWVFALAGYRGLAAVLLVMLFAFLSPLGRGPALSRGAAVIAVAIGALLLASGALLAWLLPKGVYLAFALIATASGATILRARRQPSVTASVLQHACLLACAFAAAGVAAHWGGSEAGLRAAVLAIPAALYAFAAARRSATPWQPLSAAGRWAILGLLMAGAAAAVLGNPYMSGRFERVQGDWGVRERHWSQVRALVRSPAETGFGIGLGRFPEVFAWLTPGGESPGGYAVVAAEDRMALRLKAPVHLVGWGELLRVGQRIRSDAQGPYALRFSYRAEHKTALHVEVCRRELIYPDACSLLNVELPAASSWQPFAARFGEREAGLPVRLAAPAFFAVALGSQGAQLDISGIELIDAQAQLLIDNGDFAQGMSRWFFTSDKLHLAWHAKSVWLALYTELGLFGAFAFGLFMAAALGRVLFGRAAAHPLATPLAAALCGYLCVGLFDSLIDIPRITMLVMLIGYLALSLQAPAPSARLQAAV